MTAQYNKSWNEMAKQQEKWVLIMHSAWPYTRIHLHGSLLKNQAPRNITTQCSITEYCIKIA